MYISNPGKVSCVFHTLSFLEVHHSGWLSLMAARSFSWVPLRAQEFTLKECNLWWLWHPYLLTWQEILHFSEPLLKKNLSSNPLGYGQNYFSVVYPFVWQIKLSFFTSSKTVSKIQSGTSAEKWSFQHQKEIKFPKKSLSLTSNAIYIHYFHFRIFGIAMH